MIFTKSSKSKPANSLKIKAMKRTLIPLTILVIAGLVTLMLLTKAQNRQGDLDPKRARELLDNYAKMLEGVNTQKAGLPSAADLRGATLANPRQVALVPLDKLKALDSAGSIGSILMPGTTTYYEVRGANGAVLALMEVGSKDGKYVAASFGHRAMAEAIARNGANNPSGNIVRIQALHLDFLATSDGGFVALQDVPDFGIRQGAAFSDRELLQLVQPFARKYNGLPL
jgi:hypothetical protein